LIPTAAVVTGAIVGAVGTSTAIAFATSPVD
jgi:hypothetical protein